MPTHTIDPRSTSSVLHMFSAFPRKVNVSVRETHHAIKGCSSCRAVRKSYKTQVNPNPHQYQAPSASRKELSRIKGHNKAWMPSNRRRRSTHICRSVQQRRDTCHQPKSLPRTKPSNKARLLHNAKHRTRSTRSNRRLRQTSQQSKHTRTNRQQPSALSRAKHRTTRRVPSHQAKGTKGPSKTELKDNRQHNRRHVRRSPPT